MQKTVWVITSSINAYDQEGDYLEAVFLQKPTRKDLLIYYFGGSGENANYTKQQHEKVSHMLTGGGRKEWEDYWEHLSELEVGKEYKDKQ